MGIFLGNDIGYDGGGFCANTTVYCSFGCCGDKERQICCFPIGVIIGCSFGLLGTICLLISIFRCKFSRRHDQTRAPGHGTHDASGHSETSRSGQHNTAFVNNENCQFPIYTHYTVSVSEQDPKLYTHTQPPPSYETVIASKEVGVDMCNENLSDNNPDSVSTVAHCQALSSRSDSCSAANTDKNRENRTSINKTNTSVPSVNLSLHSVNSENVRNDNY